MGLGSFIKLINHLIDSSLNQQVIYPEKLKQDVCHSLSICTQGMKRYPGGMHAAESMPWEARYICFKKFYQKHRWERY